MKLLLLNPNTSTEVTQLMTGVGQRAAAPGTELIPCTATRGVPYISTRTEAQIGGAIALDMLAEQHRNVDAAIIAAFGDPGLFAARETFDIPVVGMAEAAMLTACMAGRRFAIVTFAQALGPWYEECVRAHGCGSVVPASACSTRRSRRSPRSAPRRRMCWSISPGARSWKTMRTC